MFVQVMVTVWKREAEKAEVQELGYLSVLQQREPTHTFRHDLNTFKAQGTFHNPKINSLVVASQLTRNSLLFLYDFIFGLWLLLLFF